ncbi:MAG: DNA-3-methyladenine glycosylase [Planctomycetota bacterium]
MSRAVLAAPTPLPRAFYARSTLVVARELIGKTLVREVAGVRLAARVVEVEAYIGERDRACHARAGQTARTAVMYGEPGHTYVYFTYGMHWMLNVVTERRGFPAAVLIRALEPVAGIEAMRARRGGVRDRDLLRGPARLCQAFGIHRAANGADLCDVSQGLWFESGAPVARAAIARSARIGLGQTPEPWLSRPWRFALRDSPFVSR